MRAAGDRDESAGPTVRAARLAEAPRGAGGSRPPGLDQIMERLPLAVDRTMGEAGLWAPELAARALRQAQGDPLEAARLLRAHRTALPRLARSVPVTSDELRVTRRISSAFRSPPGGQLLGRTLDYVGRLLDLLPEDEGRTWAAREAHRHTTGAAAHRHDPADTHLDHTHPDHTHGHATDPHAVVADAGHTAGASQEQPPPDPSDTPDVARTPTGLLSVLRAMEVVAPAPSAHSHARPGEPAPGTDPEPYDITRAPARTDAPRSAWLQAMARADTGSLMHTWYGSNWRPSGHEIPGEVRHGTLPVPVVHPLTGGAVTVARVQVSEVQTFHSLARAGELNRMLDVGYGLCFGRNDRKAISMAGLDLLLRHHRGAEGPADEVLFTLDGLDSIGYVQQLKLPHHVGFRSLVERARAAAGGAPTARTRTRHTAAANNGEKE